MANEKSQPTYKRQRFLLAFIRQIDENITSTDLQKLVFLYTMKESPEFYEFVPYKFGPYSFQLAEDISILCKDGYLLKDASRIKAAENYQYELLFPVVPERGEELIRKTYREYPYFTINSEIIDRLFHGDEAEQFKLNRENYIQKDQTLFTIGYEGKSIEAFINTLIQNDIQLLCDVRKNSLSRKFGFSKDKLKHITETIGIKYVHIPDLGISSDKRRSLDTLDDYKCLFEEYAKTLPDHKKELENVYSLLCANTRIALMCYEKEPEMCHRHVIRDFLLNAHEIRSVDL
ncbi:MAG: DUF488 family protein [Oscillospiraceae bacterium]|nr:DUF488 family protein [Oscillospiraceae bacterium]